MRGVAPWRSGYAEVCKTSYTGSIPVGASTLVNLRTVVLQVWRYQTIIEPGKTGSRMSSTAKIILNIILASSTSRRAKSAISVGASTLVFCASIDYTLGIKL